ncbi:Choline transporter-like protein, partial [Globisporangium splendens]
MAEKYYWTLDKRQVRSLPVLRSWWRTIWYHFGSMAFGSLIIAIVQFFRIALEYLDQKMRATKQGNTAVKVVMERVHYHRDERPQLLPGDEGLVLAARREHRARGDREHHLEPAHGPRQGVHRVLLDVLHVPVHPEPAVEPPPGLPHRRPQAHHKPDLPDAPSLFLDVYGTGIDTILLCFCEDCNVNKGSDTYYMSDELFAYIEGPAKKNALRVFQPPTRDVSARGGGNGEGATPKGAPIFQPSSSPM